MIISYAASQVQIEQPKPKTVRERLGALVGTHLSPSKCHEIWGLLMSDMVREACRDDPEIQIMVDAICGQVRQEELRRLSEAEYEVEQLRKLARAEWDAWVNRTSPIMQRRRELPHYKVVISEHGDDGSKPEEE